MSEAKDMYGLDMYNDVCKIAFAALTIAHANADFERYFSIMRKIQTDWRQRLSYTALDSRLCAKFNIEGDCCDYEPPNEFLKSAKIACNL